MVNPMVSDASEERVDRTLGEPLSRRQLLRGAAGLAAAGAAAVALRSGASASGRQAPAVLRSSFQEKITIEVWDQQQSDLSIQDAYNQALADFQAANPDIEVRATAFPFAQYRDKLLVAVKGGTGPDIMSLDEVWTPEFAAAGVIEPLDELIASSEAVQAELFFQGAWDTNKWKDQIWGIPLNFDVWEQLYYNADMFAAAGLDPDNPPKTWDEWLAAAEQLTNPPNQFGIALIGHKGEDMTVMLNSLMYSNGGSIIDDEGNVVINSPENVEALTFFKELARFAPEGIANMSESDCVALFTAGQAAMILDGSWQQDTMNARAEFDWRIAVPPAPAGKSFVGALGGWNYGINRESKHKEAAFKLIEYLTTVKEVQKTINSLIPAMREAGLEFVQEKRKQPEVIIATLESGRPRPISPVYPQVSSVQQDMVQAIWAGTPIEDALAEAQKQIEELVAMNP